MRVALAEDSVLLREGLARLLGEAGFDVVAQCDNADDLLLKVRSYDPDVAIVDIRLPPTHNDEGLQAALDIRSQHPSVGVLVLSQYVELGLALKLLADSAEGVGYLLKDRIGDVEEFVAAVRRVAAGGSALDPLIVQTLVSRQRPDDPLVQLTPREREGSARTDGRGELEPGNRRKARDHRAGSREVRLEHLREARPAVHRQRVETRAGRADVPPLLKTPETRP
jgi:DNA-binding NarL/FixJ family response regulator